MFEYEMWWPGFWLIMALATGYGALLGYQQPEPWICKASEVAIPIVCVILIVNFPMTQIGPSWENWFSAILGVWGGSQVWFYLAIKLGTWTSRLRREETLDEVRGSGRFGRF